MWGKGDKKSYAGPTPTVGGQTGQLKREQKQMVN